jgi:ribonuclease HII
MAKRVLVCSGRHEREARARGFERVAGVDEAGRGALFGPVFAAAVILDPNRPIRGLRDSKELDSDQREVLAVRIRERAIAWSVAAAGVYDIDRFNILQASRLAMRRAVEKLVPRSDYLLIDAVTIDLSLPQDPLIHGDARCQCIAAASILAKTSRDDSMRKWDAIFPEFGLARNKGYGTEEHYAALQAHGPTTLHRFSFEPVRQSCQLDLWSGYDQGSAFRAHVNA